jgi:hypothetical protein
MGLDDDLRAAQAAKNSGKTLGKLAELLDRSGNDPDDISRVQRVNVWQGFMRGQDGEAELVDMHGISLVPRWAEGPEWPVAQPGPNVKVPARKAKARAQVGHKTAVVIPDIQIGYYRTNGDFEATHDEAAIAVMLAVVEAADPDLIVCVGDNLDLPEFGRYRLTPAFMRTTQPAIDRATVLCAELRRAAPRAEIVWLAGNHEERLPIYLLDNAKAAYGLRRGQPTPESWPVLSVPFLCHMDAHGVEYVPGYPASHRWVTERLRVIHGDLVRSQASTATAYLAREKTSVVYGHIHRREYAARTRQDHDGPREVMAASPGCLARTDGPVPSTKGGTDLDGRPVKRQEDWQQGLAVVPFDPDTGRFAYEQVAIHEGVAWWRGREYSATSG